MILKWIAGCANYYPSIPDSAGRIRAGVAYKVGPDNEVASEVAGFSDHTLQYWNVCLAEIASDPYPRTGYYVERVILIPPLPMRTYLYWITEETSVSGETLFVFTAEFFPEYALVYAVDKDASEARIFYLRPTG